jgi:hypothetical protein
VAQLKEGDNISGAHRRGVLTTVAASDSLLSMADSTGEVDKQ